jgi:CheY-like chemotaxis protein
VARHRLRHASRHAAKIKRVRTLEFGETGITPTGMPSPRKTILVIHPSAPGPATIRHLLGSMGHIAVAVEDPRAALKALATMRFDVILTSIGGAQSGSEQSFVQDLRALAPGSAVVGIQGRGLDAATEAWMGECDATIQAPLSSSRLQWTLEFELRYFGS